jgi:hypothetical protein
MPFYSHLQRDLQNIYRQCRKIKHTAYVRHVSRKVQGFLLIDN